MEYTTILYSKPIEHVAKISMNRPRYRNAQSRKMTEELLDAFDRAEQDDDVRVIILAGEGPCFSAGHDLGSPDRKEEEEKYPTPPRGGASWRMKREEYIYFDPCVKWRDIPKPTIAQVHGYCIMGGIMLASCCDIIVAADDAQFGEHSVAMNAGSVQWLPLVWDIGARMTKELLFTAGFMDAGTAWRLGLVNKVVPREKLEEETLKLAAAIALHEPFYLKLAKKLVNGQLDLMGQKQGMDMCFYLQHLAKAHNAEVGSLIEQEGKSVKEYVREMETKFGSGSWRITS